MKEQLGNIAILKHHSVLIYKVEYLIVYNLESNSLAE